MRRCRGVLERLMPSEFQVMRLVITGLLNKQVGAEPERRKSPFKPILPCYAEVGDYSVAQLIGVVKKAEVPPLIEPAAKVL
jgi:hypothetical protein